MTGLIIQNSKGYKIPECEKCDSYMLPLELDHIEKDMWKCPHCMNERKVENE